MARSCGAENCRYDAPRTLARTALAVAAVAMVLCAPLVARSATSSALPPRPVTWASQLQPGPDSPAPCAPAALFAVPAASDTFAGADPAMPEGVLAEATAPLEQRLGERLRVAYIPYGVGAADEAALATSVQDGAREIVDALEVYTQQCPSSLILVYGHSHGALVAGHATSLVGHGRTTVPPDRVRGVALLGNPARAITGETVPGDVPGAGLLTAPQGGYGALAGRVIEICAPTDPVCASSAPTPNRANAVAALLHTTQSPAHVSYSRLPTGVGELSGTQWLTAATVQFVDTATAQQPLPSPPADPTGVDERAQPGPDEAVEGLLFRAAQGTDDLLSRFNRSDYNEQSGTPRVVDSPNVPDAKALRFSVPGGGQRMEVEPPSPDAREGDLHYVAYHGFLAPDFPTETNSWQVILQWHHAGNTGSPPITLAVERGMLRLSGGDGDGDEAYDMPIAPVKPGEPVNLVFRILFSQEPSVGSVDVWKDGQHRLVDYHPPSGTMFDERNYVKVGLYRDTSIEQPGTVFLNDLRIGTTMASVSASIARN